MPRNRAAEIELASADTDCSNSQTDSLSNDENNLLSFDSLSSDEQDIINSALENGSTSICPATESERFDEFNSIASKVETRAQNDPDSDTVYLKKGGECYSMYVLIEDQVYSMLDSTRTESAVEKR